MTVETISPSSPVIERRPRSRSFGAGTPTFSSDLAKLKDACCSDDSVVHSYSEAIAIASTFDVLGPSSPLSRRMQLDTESDWIEFMMQSGAISGEDGKPISIHLEKLLRHCFDIAYKMPSSPSSKAVRSSARMNPSPIQV
mmetsp:Transcript_33342/g.70149  ORF Transcript_33342/g.70149 Transcript_33342/m.70149 type:complete len:140 (-) Transcript_33342:299-718(-)|eukprot:CAMPEP_0172306414 /NCGR_PEP_ID=MMETSP1058-20130122/7490_1 /TAXON_ID=83371 /ORGANISM="Detonula confervacea, Strain CCMP 353" /LENGTH=139 /DNA_ID=CAMNT_0013018293 /DNA_START=53 /DNA_END=472 /DNA_ORIENTATION=+